MTKLLWALALALVTQLGLVPGAAAAVNINTATAEELVALPGVGPVKAQAIVDHRKAHGPFKTVDDLRNVKGIGAKRMEKLRNDVTVGAPQARVAAAGPGTKADAMPEQLSHAVKSARAHEAQRVADACKQRYLVQQVGQTLPVLFETEHDGSWVGHSDNYCLVRAAGDDLRGLVKNVKISAVSGQMLVGDLV